MATWNDRVRRAPFWAMVALIVLPFPVLTVLYLMDRHKSTMRYREAIRELRLRYPMESLETRLPWRTGRAPGPLSSAAENQLREFETKIAQEIESYRRESRLTKLHEGTVEEFVAKEGLGVMRMFGGLAESILEVGHEKDGQWVGRNRTSVPQMAPALSSRWRETTPWPEASVRDSPALSLLHNTNLLHFVHPAGFGAVKDRRNVAGFQAHQFNAVHEEKPWKVLRLELVGLLFEERPRVYVTATMPRMQEIRDVPTRPLDAFETAGLARLQAGDRLHVGDAREGVRMLGAIRNAQQCVRCHGGARGALLGAFSYALKRE